MVAVDSWCVRLASLGHPRSAQVRSNSFWPHSRGSPRSAPSALLVEWVLGAGPMVNDITTRAVSGRSFSSFQGLTQVSTAIDPGKLNERTHYRLAM